MNSSIGGHSIGVNSPLLLQQRSSKFQTNNLPSTVHSPPPKLPPRNPISSTSSSSSNSPLTVHHQTNGKQLVNGKSNALAHKNDLARSSTIENKIAFNFMTKSSCTVNNSSSINSTNTCTIRQTTSTFNNGAPISSIVLNGSNLNSPATGFSSSIITTTTTQCVNNNQRNKFAEQQMLEQQSKSLAKANAIDAYRSPVNNGNNFVRNVFRSCNVNFGPNFKSQKYITSSTGKTPAAALGSPAVPALPKGNRLTGRTGETVDPTLFNGSFLHADSLGGKNSKLINKAIQQNGFILKQVKSQSGKNDLHHHHKTNDVTTSRNYLTNSVSSPSINSSESEEDEEETELRLNRLNGKTNAVKTQTKSSPDKLNSNHLLHNSANLKASMQVCPLQRSKTLMLNSNGKPELNVVRNGRPQRIEITTTHHRPSNSPENRSLVSSPVSTVSTKSIWMEYGCV